MGDHDVLASFWGPLRLSMFLIQCNLEVSTNNSLEALGLNLRKGIKIVWAGFKDRGPKPKLVNKINWDFIIGWVDLHLCTLYGAPWFWAYEEVNALYVSLLWLILICHYQHVVRLLSGGGWQVAGAADGQCGLLHWSGGGPHWCCHRAEWQWTCLCK